MRASAPARCSVMAEPHLSALLVPAPQGGALADGDAPRPHPPMARAGLQGAPAYAIPKDFVVCPAAEARRIGLLTANGRVEREAAKKAYPALKLAQRQIAA